MCATTSLLAGRPRRGGVLLLARSRRRASQAHLAGYSGILQADAYSGYGKLYDPGRNAGPILEAACWVSLPDGRSS
jgi:transposase